MCTSSLPSFLAAARIHCIIAEPSPWDSTFFDCIIGRLEWCTRSAGPMSWSPSSSIERVAITVAARIFRSLPFSEDLCARARSAPTSLSRALIRFREFSSTRADARPSMSRNLDASAAGIARTSFWDWLWTRPRVRDRTDRARVREGRKGSDAVDDGPADAGSSKPKESGCGADEVERLSASEFGFLV